MSFVVLDEFVDLGGKLGLFLLGEVVLCLKHLNVHFAGFGEKRVVEVVKLLLERCDLEVVVLEL